MKKDRDIVVDNSGTNSGVLIGSNSGIINNIQQVPTNIPSLILPLVKMLADICTEINDEQREILELESFKFDNKIKYNCVIKYKQIIEYNSIYYTYYNEILNVLDNSNPKIKSRILMCVWYWYLELKGEIILEYKNSKLTDIEIIRENSDLLIENVVKKIEANIHKSNDYQNMSSEELYMGILCFVCYCFMECKILEKPK